MDHSPILPPPPPRSGDEAPSLADLTAMSRTSSAPPPMLTDDEDGILDLSSWRPTPPSAFPSAFPQAWSAPPRVEGHGPRNAVIASMVVATIAIGAAAFVTWSRPHDSVVAVATPRVERYLAPVAAPAAMPVAAPAATPVAEPVAVVEVQPSSVPVAAPAPVAEPSLVPVERRARAVALEQPAAEVAAPPPTATVEVATAPTEAPAAVEVATAPTEAPVAPVEVATAPTEAAPAVVAPDPDLPAVPTRERVVAAMDGVRSTVQSCASRHGRAPVWITVRPNGRVASAIVSGTFAGTPEGSCIARAVRAAQFPAFAQDTFEVSYPFVF